MKRFLCMLIAVVMVLSTIPATSFAADFDTENFVGMVLTVKDSSFTVEMYKGITSQKTKLTPVHTEGNSYYFEVQAKTNYCYIVKPSSGNAYYSVRKNFYITADMANVKTVWDITPPARTGNGWDPTEIWCYADITMEKAFPSSPELWPDYKELLKVPALTVSRSAHQMTTQTEMMDYISGLDDAKDNMYVFTLGKSGGPVNAQLDIPVVFFTKTDLSGVSTWEEASALLRNNGKLTALYQAQIHGNEPAAGEAALAMLKAFDGNYGAGLMDNMNICVIPRLNVYGASNAARYVYYEGKDLDPNRDFLKLKSREDQLRTQLFLALEPEICFDNHEYQLRTGNTTVDMQDMQLSTNYTVKSTDDFRQTALAMCQAAFDRAAENDLGYGWYDDCVNGYNPSVGTTNVAMRGSLVFLTETNGIMGGNQQLERRMMAQISMVTGLLDYANANAEAVHAVVEAQRRDIVERGRTYEESDIIILDSTSSEHEELYIDGQKIHTANGSISDAVFTAKVYDQVVRSRTAPTAYVIPAGESWSESVVENLTKHGITCVKIPAGSVVQLQQYLEDGTDDSGMALATLTDEKQVAFHNGAYVMTMDQENSYIMAVRMEPDVNDVSGNNGTFVQEGVITAQNGKYPIYRYIHDLNSDHFIDYTVASAAPAELAAEPAVTIGGTGKITGLDAGKTYEYKLENADAYIPVATGSTEISDLAVGSYLVRYRASGTEPVSADAYVTVSYALSEYAVYLDGTNGSDDKDGYTEATANKTLKKAQQQLDDLMAHAPADTTGVIRIVGTYEITTSNEAYTLQRYHYPLLITGGKLKYTNTSTKGRGRYLRMGGDTTFANVTLEIGSAKKDYFLCGEGYQLTVGENVVSLPGDPSETKPVCYFSIVGGVGEYSNNQYAVTTDVTVRSGHWRYVYAGGYVSSVEKEAKVVLSNCSVASVYTSQNGKHDGNVYCQLENVTVRDDVLYCGNFQKNNVSGNVTLVLGEGVSVNNVYAGSRQAGNVGGTVTIVADGIDLTNTKLYGKPKSGTGTIGGLALVLKEGQLADAAESFITRDGVSVTLGCQQTKAVNLPHDITLELNGYSIADLTNEGHKLVVSDAATDDFDVADGKYGTVPASANAQAAEGYIPVSVDGKTSFHKYEIRLTELVVNTEKVGLTYKAQFHGDDMIGAGIKEFGVAVRAYYTPDQNSVLLDTAGLTHMALAPNAWKNRTSVKSVYVVDIMDKNETVAKNTARAQVPVYGIAYIKLNDGTYLFGNSSGESLHSAMQYMDELWNSQYLNDTDRTNLASFCRSWGSVMQDWTGIEKIKNAAGITPTEIPIS